MHIYTYISLCYLCRHLYSLQTEESDFDAKHIVTRGCKSDCVDLDNNGAKRFCCSEDKCNSDNKVQATSVLIVATICACSLFY